MSTPNACESESLHGTVLELKGDFALVDIEAAATCGSCCQAKACFPEGTPRQRVLVPNIRHAAPGDFVSLEQDGLKQFQLSALHYGIPLLGFLLGILIGYVWRPFTFSLAAPELWQFALGLVFLVAGGCLARSRSERMSGRGFAVFTMK